MRSIGKMFTYWKMMDYKIQVEPLYQNYKSVDNDTKVKCVKHVTVSHSKRTFGDIAHLIVSTDHNGNVKALIHADILFGDETIFIRNANLRQLEDYLN